MVVFTFLALLGSSTAFEYGELASFVRRHGGRVHRSLALADPAPCGSRGLVAAQPIPETDARTGPLVVVPASLEMSGRRARAFLEDRGAGGDDLDDGSLLVLWLAALDGERRRAHGVDADVARGDEAARAAGRRVREGQRRVHAAARPPHERRERVEVEGRRARDEQQERCNCMAPRQRRWRRHCVHRCCGNRKLTHFTINTFHGP